MKKLLFALLIASFSMVADDAKTPDKPKEPPAISADDQIRILKLVRDFEQAGKAKLQAEANWRSANEIDQSTQKEFQALLAELQKKYHCTDCSLDLKDIKFNAPPAKPKTEAKKEGQ